MTSQNDNGLQASDKGEVSGGLAELMRRAKHAGKGLPPVEKWHPPFCGDIDMRIARDGLWYYMGTPIGREEMVRLFSTVLRKDEDGKTYLVTPVEKIGIIVDDAHFLGVELHSEGDGDAQILTLRTNVGDVVTIGPDHPLRFVDEDGTEGVKPYVHMRGRLDALMARPLLYQIVDLGCVEDVAGVPTFGIKSFGEFYPIMPEVELNEAAFGDG